MYEKNIRSTEEICIVQDSGITCRRNPGGDGYKTQLLLAILNQEHFVQEADYGYKTIVRLNVYTTTHEEFLLALMLLNLG